MMVKEHISRVAELERLFQKYPDVPKEAIVKGDMLLQGVTFTDAALQRLDAEPTKLKSYEIFSFDRVRVKEMRSKESFRVPESVRFKDGVYQLRPTSLSVRIATGSPYLVDLTDGKWSLLVDGEYIASVEFPPRPKYYDLVFEDGTQYRELFPLVNWNYTAFCTVTRYCEHFTFKEQCKFCDLNPAARELKKSGLPYTVFKPLNKVSKVARTIFRDPEYRAPDARWVAISGGTIRRKLRGMGDTDFYVRYTEAIREQVGGRPGIFVQTAAKEKADCKRLRDAGATSHCANYEVWDRRLFGIICPGKERIMGYDQWIRRIIDSVDVFGEGNVIPAVVVGPELVQPHGFKSMDEGVKSNAEGFEFLMSHGVVPRVIVWCVEPWSVYGRELPPPLEYIIRVNKAWYETWVKYELPPIPGMGLMGPGRATGDQYINYDMGY